jgi:S1-C subfamily serine protease
VRRAAALAAALALVAAGCDTGGDGDGDENAGAPREVTTTRVQVVEGIGKTGGFDPGQIYERLSPGVVTITSVFEGGTSPLEDQGEAGQGSGFVVDGQGYIATNAHVVTIEDLSGTTKRANRIYVAFLDGNRVSAEIVGADLNADVALLKVDPEGLKLTPLPLGVPETIEVGEPVAAIGSPFGERQSQSLSVGVVSALDRSIQSLTQFEIGDAIQTDAAINPGNSGGPLLDAQGRVIGVNAQIRSRSGGGEGVGFAVPVDAVRRSLRELRERGRVDYGYLGVGTQVLYPQLAERLDLGVRTGALVQQVEEDSPAEDAGLEAGDDEITFQDRPVLTGGDVIVAVDGKRLTLHADLADVISSMSTGDRVRLQVLRDGKRRTVVVTLGRRPDRSSE